METQTPDISSIKNKIASDKAIKSVLGLADNALIMGHRLSEWAGHGPILEQDIAISNVALDHIGQARNLYQYAAELIGDGATEDHLAYFRDAADFQNAIFVELPNGDWGRTIIKLFLFSSYQQLLYTALSESTDKQLAGIAAKSLKEVLYHVRWSSEWVVRLGDGTEESNKRMQNAISDLWPYSDGLFTSIINQELTINIKEHWLKKISLVLEEATLKLPIQQETRTVEEDYHSEHLEPLLKEMQVLQRTYPGCQW